MIRAAIRSIPINERHRTAAACMAGTGATACLLAAQLRFREHCCAKCSPSTQHNGGRQVQDSMMAFPASSSLPNFFDDIEHCCSFILPTLEALLRAARLVKTAIVMAVDYQAHRFQRKDPDAIISQVYSLVFLSDKHIDDDGHSEHDCKQKHLEDTIERLERDLERAQHDYVNHKPSSEDRLSDTDSTNPKLQLKQVMLDIAGELATAQEELSSLIEEGRQNTGNGTESVHQRNAHRLLGLCRTNGGVYIKVGQHLANLDLLLPVEYIRTLSSLFDDAPISSYQDVCHVLEEQLGSLPEKLFDDFSKEPFASASLAQVHTATCKETGKKLAIKVQHKGLKETSKGDLFAMATVVSVADKLFDDFNFGWICEELTPQLPRELDFNNEGKNAEAAAAHLKNTGLDCVVPRVLWNCTSDGVLTMEFEEGFRATDIESIDKAGICRRDVAKLISSVFNAQIFENGFVHCDPHEANVLLREHPSKKGMPQIVLVDHGLYKTLDEDFQEAYARLWRGLVMANIPEIKSACEKLGVNKMYPLLAAMLTSRPFDEIIERSNSRSLDATTVGNGDKAVIRGYAQRYIKEIIMMLDIVPRQMLLIFKMNDCLRHVDMALGSPVNNLVVAGRYASKRVFEGDQKKRNGGVFSFLRSWLSYVHVLIRINSYEFFTRLAIKQ